jgi:hypothetical protein
MVGMLGHSRGEERRKRKRRENEPHQPHFRRCLISIAWSAENLKVLSLTKSWGFSTPKPTHNFEPNSDAWKE